VVWQDLSGSLIYKQFRYPTPVLQAVWAYFNYDKPATSGNTTTTTTTTNNNISVLGDDNGGDGGNISPAPPPAAAATTPTPSPSSTTTSTSSTSTSTGLSLCVLRDAELVVVYAPDGRTYDVALPCHAARIWPLTEGLLIQRPPNAEASASSLGPSSPRWADLHRGEGEGETPSLFSLMHPLDELKPVALDRDQDNDVRMGEE